MNYLRALMRLTALSGMVLAGGAAHAEATAPAPNADADYEVVVYWAPWCAACAPVLESMGQLAQANTLGVDVRFTAANIGDAQGAAQALRRKGGGALLLEQTSQQVAGLRAIPWIEIRDAAGRLVATPAAHTHPRNMTAWVEMDLAMRL